MDFTNRVSQTLHDEHSATVALIERTEQLLGRNRRNDPPDTADPAVSRLLRDLSAWVDAEIKRHFSFEEDELFTYLEARGDKTLSAHLSDEHRAIRSLGARIGALAHEASDRPFDAANWNEFWRLGQELCERILAHVQKEEMALLPVIEDAMDPDTEARLYQEYLDTV